jgi:two-component system, chemotaxis family, protein-glutamate methylesterase/glutaminase
MELYMIRVLIVEDSPIVRDFLRHLLSTDPEIQVIGTASDGEAVLDAVQRQKPDAITMDIHMPGMNGWEATRKIMETQPTPVVIVSSSVVADEVTTIFRAIEAGALAAVPRPQGLGHQEYEATAQELIQTVKLMSEVKVVRRWPRPNSGSTVPAAPEANMPRASTAIEVVAIGASTGGPLVLQTLLSGLPKDFSVPVLIVQHMASGSRLCAKAWNACEGMSVLSQLSDSAVAFGLSCQSTRRADHEPVANSCPCLND